MTGLPLHPAIVHLPLGLAMLMPLMAAGFGWALITRRVRPRAWAAVVAMQALLLGSALVAINTGGQDEDRVEAVVAESAIEEHEEAAEQFAWATGATLALTGLVLVFSAPATASALAAASLIATIVVGGLALRVGHAGGQLVYAQGAAAAYASAQPSAGAPPLAHTGGDDDDDDDRRPVRR